MRQKHQQNIASEIFSEKIANNTCFYDEYANKIHRIKLYVCLFSQPIERRNK